MDCNFTNAPPGSGDDPEKAKYQANLAYVKRMADKLGEHFDCVVVLAHIVDHKKGQVSRYTSINGDPLAAQQAAILFANENSMQFMRSAGNGPNAS